MKGFAGTNYDEVPYLAASFPNTHPDTLAATAVLRGLEPRLLAGTRVLELGCARGGNLVPMAASMPDASFVGVDLSPRQIDDAREMARVAGVANVTFHAMDLRAIDGSYGEFDYVIAHGLFSWVPTDVQESILEVCANRLSPAGIAYISYNTYPGWHLNIMLREMLLYRTRTITDPGERLREARVFLRFLADSAQPKDGIWAVLLRSEAEYFERERDWYLLHDDLEGENNPVYFHEIAERAARHGLQYLTEQRWGTPDEVLAPKVWEGLDRFASSRIEREQCLDFIRNGRFRRSLFCRADRALSQGPAPGALARRTFRTRVRPTEPAADPLAPGVEAFVGESGHQLTTADVRLRALLHALYDAWPRALGHSDVIRVLAEAAKRTDGEPGPPPQALESLLVQALAAQLVSTHVVERRIATDVTERPVAMPVARYQAARSELVTNGLHQSLDLPPLDQLVLPLLDGTRTEADVATAIAGALAAGRLMPTDSGGPAEEGEETLEAGELARRSIRRLVDRCYVLG